MNLPTNLPNLTLRGTWKGPRPENVLFGAKVNPYEPDPYEANPDKKKAEQILNFVEPKPSSLLQRALLTLNRYIALPFVSRVEVSVPVAEIKKLKALPKNAGLIMVAPHPDSADGQVMSHVFNLVGKVPTGFLMASEALQSKSWLVKQMYNRMGAIPVVRGKSNPEAMNYLTQRIANGGWGQIFPEGAIYHSRKVMPMEYGAYKMGVEAAIMVQEEAEKNGTPADKLRPILLAPYSHVYFHSKPAQMQKNMNKALKEIEALPEIYGKAQDGPLIDRMKAVADRILESRVERYNIQEEAHQGDWKTMDIYDKAEKVQNILLEQVEKKYSGGVQEGYARRRAMKVRMSAYEVLKNPDISEALKKETKEDIKKTLDIVALVAFERDYKTSFSDLETWAEFLRRFRDAVSMSYKPFGDRKAVVKMLPPIDMHPIAREYRKLATENEKKEYLFKLTEELRGNLQQGIVQICQETKHI